MEIKLSELIAPLKELTRRLISRDFVSLVSDGLITHLQADDFNRVFNEYPFEVVSPPDQEYWRALGVAANSFLRDQITQGVLPTDENFELYSQEMINAIYIQLCHYEFDIEILLGPDPQVIQTTTYICLCVEARVSHDKISLVPINMFVS